MKSESELLSSEKPEPCSTSDLQQRLRLVKMLNGATADAVLLEERLRAALDQQADDELPFPFSNPGRIISQRQLVAFSAPIPDGQDRPRTTFELLNFWARVPCEFEELPEWILPEDAALYRIAVESTLKAQAALWERQKATVRPQQAAKTPTCAHDWRDRHRGAGRWCVKCGALSAGGFVAYAGEVRS